MSESFRFIHTASIKPIVKNNFNSILFLIHITTDPHYRIHIHIIFYQGMKSELIENRIIA